MIRGDDRGRVVAPAVGVGELERAQPERAGDVGDGRIAGDRGPRAREPLESGRRRRERLQRVQRADADPGAPFEQAAANTSRPREPARCTTSAPGSIAGSAVEQHLLDGAVGRGDEHERRAAGDLGDRARAATRGTRRPTWSTVRRARDRRRRRTVQPCSIRPSAIVVPARPGPIRATVRRCSAMECAMLPPPRCTPSQAAAASTRSGATSRRGARTNPRSHIRGCGSVRSGSSSRMSSYRSTSTSSVRGPQRSTRTRCASRSIRCASASSACGSSVGVDRDDGVQVRVLGRTADGRGLVHARDRDDVDAGGRVERVDRELEMRGAVAQIRAEREVRAYRSRLTARRARRRSRAARARVGAACAPRRPRRRRADRRGTPRRCASRAVRAGGTLRRHDAAHRVAHRGVVDGVVEIVARARGATRRRASSTSTSNGCGRTCSSGSTPCTPSSRMPEMRMRSTARR